VPVVIEFSVTKRIEEQGVSPVFLVKDEHFGLRIVRRHQGCSAERFLVCSARMATGIEIEIITVAVDDADY